MPLERLEISNWEALGLLIKTWATNEDRLKIEGKQFLPKPASIAAFCVMLVDANVTNQEAIDRWLAAFGGTLNSLSFVQSTPYHLYIRLPMEQMLLEMEQKIQNSIEGQTPFDYPLPLFYSHHIFDGVAPNVTEPMKVHAERIGDYTIAQCG